jgi:hypothetical protein
VFAVSCTPSFYLNSRNRPGPLSIPGDPLGSLNVLPGAPLQPADICSTEYLDNETMAWVIRLTLALSARVVASVGVQSCGAYSYSSRRNLRGHLIETSKGSAFAQRVIYAQGLGTPKRFFTHPRLLDFTQFMARMDERFPLQGVEKVAVVGNGDSARTTIESLLGLGPPLGMSVATLDWPRQVHWYGPGTAMTCDSWLAANRTRYAGIAAGLPRNKTNASPRIVPKDVIDTARILPGYNSILVEEKPFDLVIDCTGWTPSYVPSVPTFENYTVENRLLAKRNGTTRYQIGPASELPLSADENTLISAIVENSTSLFRYAGRTAQLAAMLPA